MALWAVALAALTAPNPVEAAAGWLDGSWRVGLDLASRLHMPMGSRLFFSYGPYGFLDSNVPYFGQQWLRAVAVSLAIHVGFIVALAVLLRRVRAGWIIVGATSVVLFLALPALAMPDVEGAMLAAVLGVLAVGSQTQRAACISGVAAGLVLALLLLVKGSGLVIVVGMLPVLIGSALLGRRRDAAVALGAGFVVSSTVLWWGTGMGAADWPRWLRNTVETASGYAAAQFYGGLTVAMFMAIATLLLFAVLALAAAVQRRRIAATWLLLCLLLDFAAFKEAFIRDGPVRDAIYYGEVAILVAAAFAVLRGDRWLRTRRGWPTVAATLLMAPLVAGMIQQHNYGLDWSRTPTALRHWLTAAHAAVSATARRNLETQVRASADANYGALISAARLPQGATVDFFGLEVGFFYADEAVRWVPRPVLQSYQAYTPWLEQQDADFYAGPDAPDYVMFRNVGLDGRYSVFDEPAMFRVLVERYRFVRALDDQTVLLQRRTAAATAPVERAEGRACAPVGQPIAVPQVPDRALFGRLVMDYSVRGRAVDLGLKPAEVRIALDTHGGEGSYRFIWPVARDGIYLSSRVDDAGELGDVFAQVRQRNAVTSLALSTVAPWEWKTPVCVDFFSVQAG